MATIEKNLSSQHKELVAVGASIGAGCHPCVSHHLQAGAETGLDPEQLLAAVTSAERVTAEAAVLMGDHVRGTLGPEVSPAFLSRLEETLASLGAALSANDKTNIERQLKAAAELGISRDQLHDAIETARVVQENASRIHIEAAAGLLDSLEEHPPAPPRNDCGCGAAEQPVDASKGTPTTESASATAGGCAPGHRKFASGGFAAMMASFCAPSDDAGKVASFAAAMENCPEMFEHPSTEPSPTASTAAKTEVSAPCNVSGEEEGR